MMEMGTCFLLLCPSIWRSPKQTGWVAGLPLFHIPKIQAYFTFDGTLVFNDCMEWVNIPRWGGYRLGWHGQKIHFPFLVKCAISGYQKGLVDCKDHQRLSVLETDTQLTFHWYIPNFFAIRDLKLYVICLRCSVPLCCLRWKL